MKRNYTIRQLLQNQIRIRYAQVQRPATGKMNVVVDTYAPLVVFDAEPEKNFTNSSVAISEGFSNMFGVRLAKTDELLKELRVTKSEIKALLTKVKKRKLHFVFTGMGGVGTNTYYWLERLCREFDTYNLFKQLSVYDEDTLVMSNMLRMPMDTFNMLYNSYRGGNKIYKVDLIPDRSVVSNKIYKGYMYLNSIKKMIDATKSYYARTGYMFDLMTLYNEPDWIVSRFKKEFNIDESREISTDEIVNKALKRKYSTYLRENRYLEYVRSDYLDDVKRMLERDDVYFFGAPNLESRDVLSNANFIASTHSGDDARLWFKPQGYNEMMVETYGLINLGTFFMNQLLMTIELLRFLAEPDHTPDREIVKFNFKEHIENHGEVKLRFQYDANITVGEQNV